MARDKKDEIFNYRQLANRAWAPIIKKGQEFYKINFDLENDEVAEKKTLFVEKNLRKDQPVKYEFNCELHIAGGDWECPVMYFKVEITSEYGIITKDYNEHVFDGEFEVGNPLNKCHVLIPGEDINNLAKTDHGWTAHTDDSLRAAGLKIRDVKITDEDKKKAWQWLENLLTKIVNTRHKSLDSNNQQPTNEEPQEPTGA